jgi:hypothetical protein
MRARLSHLIALRFVMSSFLSHGAIVALTSPHLQVTIATDLGRVTELTETGGPNLLFVQPPEFIETARKEQSSYQQLL